ncbi:uncharacterized protein [Macrobrachium rosenbergii]|uniref:uncharacterized protein n=1 Tax=Macrobrachium rosenbergii TaxID=79674 RepID=UPI0034D46FF6
MSKLLFTVTLATIILSAMLQITLAKQKNSWWTKRSLLPAFLPKLAYQDSASNGADPDEDILTASKTTTNVGDLDFQKEIDIALVYGVFSPCFTYSSLQRMSPCHCIVHRMFDVISGEETGKTLVRAP